MTREVRLDNETWAALQRIMAAFNESPNAALVRALRWYSHPAYSVGPDAHRPDSTFAPEDTAELPAPSGPSMTDAELAGDVERAIELAEAEPVTIAVEGRPTAILASVLAWSRAADAYGLSLSVADFLPQDTVALADLEQDPNSIVRRAHEAAIGVRTGQTVVAVLVNYRVWGPAFIAARRRR